MAKPPRSTTTRPPRVRPGSRPRNSLAEKPASASQRLRQRSAKTGAAPETEAETALVTVVEAAAEAPVETFAQPTDEAPEISVGTEPATDASPRATATSPDVPADSTPAEAAPAEAVSAESPKRRGRSKSAEEPAAKPAGEPRRRRAAAAKAPASAAPDAAIEISAEPPAIGSGRKTRKAPRTPRRTANANPAPAAKASPPADASPAAATQSITTPKRRGRKPKEKAPTRRKSSASPVVSPPVATPAMTALY